MGDVFQAIAAICYSAAIVFLSWDVMKLRARVRLIEDELNTYEFVDEQSEYSEGEA